MSRQFCLTLALGLLSGCVETHDIFEAARLGDGQRVAACLAAGIAVNQRDATGATALHWAALGGQDHIVKLLIDTEADVNVAESGSGMSPLHGVARWNRLTTAKLLLANGAKVDVRDRFGRTPLFDAMVKNRFEMIDLLLGSSVDLSARNNEGQTPLDWAIAHRKPKLIEHLRARGAQRAPAN
jgi:ankyrin repeat protein|tara:strand:+ start:151 stop:699 length:549 start_codon:yes stop_codon:yes gene_type:complete